MSPFKKNIGSGDNGKTDISKRRVSKKSDIILLNGLIDEVNALISCVIVKERMFDFLLNIQRSNSIVMSYIAGYIRDDRKIESLTKDVEYLIDKNQDVDIKEFVYFSKNEISSLLNLIRTKVRICEIYAFRVKKKKAACYLNRLSDLFFIFAFKYENNMTIST